MLLLCQKDTTVYIRLISDVMKYATRLHRSLRADQAASEQHQLLSCERLINLV